MCALRYRYIVFLYIKDFVVFSENEESSLVAAYSDCCFKISHALHAEYPVESKPVWYFIQKGFYKLKISWDTEYVTVNSLISDVGILV
jgi:hypothetical protein